MTDQTLARHNEHMDMQRTCNSSLWVDRFCWTVTRNPTWLNGPQAAQLS
jgi:hypothetical protein